MTGRVGRSTPHEAYLGALAGLDGLGPVSLRILLDGRTPQEAWDQVRSGRIPARVAAAFPRPTRRAMSSWPEAARAVDPLGRWEAWRRAGIGVVSLGQPGYPPSLSNDPEPPVVLFHRGDPDVLATRRVAIVGTRRATGYGRRVANDLARGLAQRGVCVVSGLALGIDAAAHRGAVAAMDAAYATGDHAAGPAAVVAGGVDAPGPVTNADLAREIIRCGVVLSEVAPGTAPAPWRFPVRNRILAGLAEVVVVVESAETGGSMSSVEEAERRGRTVLAVPGPVDSPASAGTNRLIAEGAGVCVGVHDVLLALGWTTPDSSAGEAGRVDRSRRLSERRQDPTGDAGAVLGVLGFSPTPIETLSRELDMDLGRLSVALGELESLGWAERNGPFIERIASGEVRGNAADPP